MQGCQWLAGARLAGSQAKPGPGLKRPASEGLARRCITCKKAFWSLGSLEELARQLDSRAWLCWLKEQGVGVTGGVASASARVQREWGCIAAKAVKAAAASAWLLGCLQASKTLFEEKFKSGKNRWFFSKLRF